MATTYAEIARIILSRVPRRNPIVGGVIVADLGLVNGSQMVSALIGGATRQAVYLSPLALQIPGNAFFTRAGPELDAPILCITTNYQVPVATFGWGASSWGTSGWGG